MMKCSDYLLWLIPSYSDPLIGFEDGEPIYIGYEEDFTDINSKQHKDWATEFCIKCGFDDYPVDGSHDDWGDYFTKHGFAVFFNAAIKEEEKFWGMWYFPLQLSSNQIGFMERIEEVLREDYISNPEFLSIKVQNNQLEDGLYTEKSFRNLTLEAYCDGYNDISSFDLFHKEVCLQKENLENYKFK